MQLVIAEKPSVARDLARALGVPARGAQAFESERWVITWCVGHLVELEEPAAYDPRWKTWRLDTLPILPGELRLRAATHARAQLSAVTRLLRDRRFTGVVNACDAGREGELIFRYLLRYAGVNPPVRRLWISSLTDEAIRKGLAALRPGAELDALGDAARCRSEADWLVGMNATRAVTARARDTGGSTLYSIGRVQTPTLAMLVARERELEEFVPTPYWEVRAELTPAQGPAFSATWRHPAGAQLARAELAQQVVARAGVHGAAASPHGPRVEQLSARTIKEPPPLLFDLTSLQRTANRRFGFSAAHTLEVAQALYERAKLLTYPRTDSRHLSSELTRELPALFEALAEVPDYQRFASALVAHPPRPGRRVIDDSKVRDHHAIIPTAKVSAAAVASLGRDERRLFDLVARRFLGAFFPDAEVAVTEVWLAVGPGTEAERRTRVAAVSTARPRTDAPSPPLAELPPPPEVFFARGRVRTVAGWQEVAGLAEGNEPRAGERDEEPAPPLPALVRGQKLDGRFSVLAKQTTPPPRYTEATLLGAMEAAGKTIDDEALREAMKERGLGTPATRAAIIETLLRREYVVRDGKQLVPTATGRSLIAALAVPSLRSPELTGEWEARLLRIARGQDSRAAFMADISRYVTELVAAVRAAPPPEAPPGEGQQLGVGGARTRRGTRAARGTRARGRAAGRGRSMKPRARAAPRAPASADAKSERPARARRTTASLQATAPATATSSRRAASPSRRPRATPSKNGTADRGARRAPRATIASTTPSKTTRASSNPTRAAGSEPIFVPVPHALAEAALAAQTAVARAVAGTRPPQAERKAADDATPPPRSPSTAPATTNRPPPPPATATRRPSPPALDPAELACPRCGQGHLVTGQRGWGCSRWREGCRFVIWFHTAGKTLSPTQLRDLVRTGKTRKATFQDATGTPISGRLVIDPTADHGAARLEPA